MSLVVIGLFQRLFAASCVGVFAVSRCCSLRVFDQNLTTPDGLDSSRREWALRFAGVRELRPTWAVRTLRGAVLTIEYDRLRSRWRVDPGGYERRELADALAQATGGRSNAAWIVQTVERLTVEARRET